MEEMTEKEMIKMSIEEFSKLQDYMSTCEKDSESYKKMKRKSQRKGPFLPLHWLYCFFFLLLLLTHLMHQLSHQSAVGSVSIRYLSRIIC